MDDVIVIAGEDGEGIHYFIVDALGDTRVEKSYIDANADGLVCTGRLLINGEERVYYRLVSDVTGH